MGLEPSNILRGTTPGVSCGGKGPERLEAKIYDIDRDQEEQEHKSPRIERIGIPAPRHLPVIPDPFSFTEHDLVDDTRIVRAVYLPH